MFYFFVYLFDKRININIFVTLLGALILLLPVSQKMPRSLLTA
jgi:hypothetical protein